MGGGVKRSVSVSILILIMFFSYSQSLVNAQFVLPGFSKSGPYIDKIIYNVIGSDEEQVLAIQNNEIDLIGDMINPTYLPMFEASEFIEISNVLRNGYGYIAINCAKYPFNITEFRRALAFALDKQAISDDVWDGLSVPLDSCIPMINPFSCEGHLDYNYYEANVEHGNQLLDDLGMVIDPISGFRLTPNGDPFDVLIECALSSNIAIEVGQKIADALTALHVDATSEPTDFYEYFPGLLPWHCDYDIVFFGESFTNFDVDWLAYEYWSEYVDEPYYNFPNWQNATYDSWRDQLLHATEYEDVYEAAFKMQEIFVHACPIIVCYENILLSAYRTDRFDGFINDVSKGVPGWWTNYKVHLKPGQTGAPWGGELRWSTPLDLDTFNFMTSSSAYTNNVLQMMYDSLIRIDSEGLDVPWLAESWIAETHDDNPSVPVGNTRFTFELIQNATWSDGQPITAEDVAFTLNYYRDAPGNPFGVELGDMMSAYTPSQYTMIVQFNTESYWHLHNIAYLNIIPMHVFLDLGLENWNVWDPQPPGMSMVTSGSFNVSDYLPGEYCELTYNQDYFFGLCRNEGGWSPYTSLTTSVTNPGLGYWSTTTTTTITTTHPDYNSNTSSPLISTTIPSASYLSTIGWSITAGSLVVIVVFSILILKERKSI